MTQLGPQITTLVNLLNRNDKNFVPRDRLAILVDLLYTKISNTSNPSWGIAGAYVVHKLNHALHPTFVEVDCCEATPNDTHPHYHVTNVIFMLEMYNKCLEKMVTDVVTGGFLPTAVAGAVWNAGVFEFLARLHAIGCKGVLPPSVMDTVLKGMVGSEKLFLPENWVICRGFVDEVNKTMWDADGGSKSLLWYMMKELIGRVLVGFGSQSVDEEVVPPMEDQARDVAAMTAWMQQIEQGRR